MGHAATPLRKYLMKQWLQHDLVNLIAGLDASAIVIPSAAGTAARPRLTHGGPVPIPFYFEPSPHAHEHVEIALVLEGPVFVDMEGKGRRVSKGSVVILPPQVRHYDSYLAKDAGYSILWYIMWPGKPRANLSRYVPGKGFQLAWVADITPERIADDDWAFVSTFHRGRKPSAGRTRELLFALYAATLEAARRSGNMKRTDVARKVVRDAVEFLHEHLCEAPTVEMAAEYVGLSSTYLTTLVRKELGQPLHDILAEMRLERARKLLLESTLSIKEVAHLSGFSTGDYFSRIFRRATGMPPRRFREKSSL